MAITSPGNASQLKAELAAKPRSSGLRHQLSRALAAEGKADEAIAQSLASLEYGKPSANHYAHLANLLLKNQMPRGAEMIARHALGIGLQTAPLYYRLAQSLRKQRKFADAIKCADYALSLNPNNQSYKKFREAIKDKAK